MILYRIRHKPTGQFLQHIDYLRTNDVFTDYGCFWKTTKTIRRHLLTLATEYEVDMNFGHANHWFARRKAIEVFPECYDLYEVVATHVTVNAENTMSATDFMMPQGATA
mgnify:FL=1